MSPWLLALGLTLVHVGLNITKCVMFVSDLQVINLNDVSKQHESS